MLNTGFSEITEDRVKYTGDDPWYLEVCITGRCNFNCKYCNRFSQDLDFEKFKNWINPLRFNHIQITGGEPTVVKNFKEIVTLCRAHTKVLGLSTNGSWSLNDYLEK